MIRLLALLSLAALGSAADFRAGVAKVDITPHEAIYLSGYAARTHASEGVVQPLWAKALALEDRRGNRLVLVSLELIGIPRGLADTVAARAQKEHQLERSQLLLNASHTHAGPHLANSLDILFDLGPQDRSVVETYTQRLTRQLGDLVGEALRDLQPVNLSTGHGRATFAINRRENRGSGVQIGVNPKGPSDHDVPVIRVERENGGLLAVVFGYACHNTTLGGDFYQVSGDYSGFAQYEVEKSNPGATALFIALCGGDQNPHPRGSLDLAEQHGKSLAAEVNRVLGSDLRPVKAPIRTAFQTVDLFFRSHTRETFEAKLNDSNVYVVRNARAMLKMYDAGRPRRRYPYPVQAVAFGKDLTLVALGGEVVVDYALRLKKERGEKGLIVAGYSNDVMSYIPSARVLREGGYEAVSSQLYYGMPAPYREDVEEIVFATINKVLRRVGR